MPPSLLGELSSEFGCFRPWDVADAALTLGPSGLAARVHMHISMPYIQLQGVEHAWKRDLCAGRSSNITERGVCRRYLSCQDSSDF
jgi:hypothetical protein